MDDLIVRVDQRDITAYQQAYWRREATAQLLDYMRRANTKPCARTMRMHRQNLRDMRAIMDKMREKYIPEAYRTEGYAFFLDTQAGNITIYKAQRGADDAQV